MSLWKTGLLMCLSDSHFNTAIVLIVTNKTQRRHVKLAVKTVAVAPQYSFPLTSCADLWKATMPGTKTHLKTMKYVHMQMKSHTTDPTPRTLFHFDFLISSSTMSPCSKITAAHTKTSRTSAGVNSCGSLFAIASVLFCNTSI